MAKRTSLAEQLNDAVEAIMADPSTPLPAADPRLTELLQIAADLRDLPTEAFKARLKADLQGRESVASSVQPIPQGYHSATPCLVVRDAPRAIEFYKLAFGATELMRLADPDGKIMHAEIKIGDSPIAMTDEFPQWGNLSPQSLGGSPVIIQVYVEDVDALATQAVAAGAKVVFPVADQFYGDRSGRLADPFGHIWIVSTHKEDVSPEEVQRRAEAFARQPEQVAAGPTAEAAERVTAQSAAPPAPTAAVAGTTAHSHGAMPFLYIRGAVAALEFYKKVLGATELMRQVDPSGVVSHVQIKAGDAQIMIRDPSVKLPAEYVAKGLSRTARELGGTPVHLYLYVEDVDSVFSRALVAGAKVVDALGDKEWGDRCGGFQDPFGHIWYVATPLTDAAR